MPMFKRSYVVLLVILASACGSSSTTSPTATTSTSTRIIGLSGSLSFGSLTVGQSATANLTISNSGNATLTVSGITVPSVGGVVPYSASFTSGSIAAGGSQPVTIRFAPTAAASYNGTLIVNGDQTSGTNTINISGTGVIATANVQLASSTANFTCVTGLCTSLTFPVTNLGPGCATNAQIVTRAYGSDGNGIQLGVDIPMGLPGGSLSSFLFRVGTTVTLQSIGTFNDVRSAHTAFKTSITWTDVACQ